MTPTKGIAEAIRIARAAGERLVLIGPVSRYLPWSRAFYEEEVLPHVDGDRVTHIEEAPNAEVLDVVSRAKAFLFPLQWDEPFGTRGGGGDGVRDAGGHLPARSDAGAGGGRRVGVHRGVGG